MMKSEKGLLQALTQLVPRTRAAWLTSLALLMVFGILVFLIAEFLPIGVDWEIAFKPAAVAAMNGRSPYIVPGFFNPPWTVIPLIPLAALPTKVGWGLYTVVGLLILAILAVRFEANRLTFALFLSSPPVLHGILNGNLDWLALSGLLFPRWIGFFLILIKPQIGIGVAIYWVADIYRREGLNKLLMQLTPVAVASGISFLLFGLWPLRSTQEIGLWWNASLWPWSIPFGLAFLFIAIRANREDYSLISSPMLSPYVLLHSWVAALFAALSSTKASLLLIGGIWLWVLFRAIALY